MKQFISKLFLVFSIIVALAALIYVLNTVEDKKSPEVKKFNLIITGLGTGNIHPVEARFRPYRGRTMGGFAQMATVINQIKESTAGNAAFSLVSLGNEFAGSADANLTSGSAIVEIMNSMSFDLMLVGNMEFTFGHERLAQLSQIASFSLLSSNVVIEDTLKSPEYILSQAMIEHDNGLRVSFVGLTPPETPTLTPDANVSGLKFLFPKAAFENSLAKIRADGVDIVVLLTAFSPERVGFDILREIASLDVDVLIMVDNSVEAPAPVDRDGMIIKTVSSYNRSMEVDVLKLAVCADTGGIVDFSGDRIAVDNAVFDPCEKVLAVIKKQTKIVQEAQQQQIGYFADKYYRSYHSECPVGNLITDAMLYYTEADIAIHNSGGIRSDISSGAFSLADLHDVLPFENSLISMDLKGTDLVELFRQSATLSRGLLQVSGVSYAFEWIDADNQRLLEVLIDGAPIDEDKTFRVVTNSFLSGGGDFFEAFTRGSNVETGLIQRNVVRDYISLLSEDGPIGLATESRIIRIVDETSEEQNDSLEID